MDKADIDRAEPPAPAPDATLLPGVVAPRLLPAAAHASVRQQAIESIGTYEWQDFTRPTSSQGSRLVNTNGDYWTHLADLAWRRDIEIHLDRVPLDLDQDGTVDTHVTRDISLKGGILGNPEVFGLAADPDDPPGKLGYTSASTGFSGLRDALDFQTGKPTGEIGMTCWLCHSGRNPVDGKTVLGLPSARLDYGMMLATSSLFDPAHVLDLDHDGVPDDEADIKRRMRLAESLVLDLNHDGQVTVAEYRQALKLPGAKQVQASLLLAGPGRADLTNEFGLDMSAPGLHSRRYADVGAMRTGTRGRIQPQEHSKLALGAFAVRHQLGGDLRHARGRLARPLRRTHGTKPRPRLGRARHRISTRPRRRRRSHQSRHGARQPLHRRHWPAGRFLPRHHVRARFAPQLARAARARARPAPRLRGHPDPQAALRHRSFRHRAPRTGSGGRGARSSDLLQSHHGRDHQPTDPSRRTAGLRQHRYRAAAVLRPSTKPGRLPRASTRSLRVLPFGHHTRDRRSPFPKPAWKSPAAPTAISCTSRLACWP